VDIDYGAGWKFTHRDFSLKDFKRITTKWQDFMYFNSGWNALYLENHDQPRTVSRFCDDSPEYRVQSAKMLATCTGFQAGTPYIYQGQELGMVNVPKEWGMEEYKDLECVNHWVEVQTYIKDQKVLDAFRVEYHKKSRDNARTPMQWANAPHGGFTESKVKPWMRANPSYEFINAESQVNDPASAFSFYKEILKLRKEYVDVFVYGAFELVDGTEEDEDLLVYRRTYKGHEAVVVCNWSGKNLERSLQDLGLGEVLDSWKVLLENDASFEKGANEVKIRPWSSFVLYRAA
jgi:glycosidase